MLQALPQFDYIFAISMIFAFLDAWNIGANDVANSFATSVSSRSLTLMQAMAIGSVTEFVGAVTVGARVADTIRSKILKVDQFKEQPEVLMLGMMCALIGSSLWLTVATRYGLPVSTTHCIVGGVLGMGIASLGVHGVNWGWQGTGVSQVFASWFIAPAISAIFAAMIFLITKHGVLLRRNPLKKGFFMVPLYFGVTSGILTMLIVWKGAATLNLATWTTGQVVGTIFGVALTVAFLITVFFLPYLHRKLVLEDWTMKWYHVFHGPLLLMRGDVPANLDAPRQEVVPDYYRGHATKADILTTRDLDEESPSPSPAGNNESEHNQQDGRETSLSGRPTAAAGAEEKKEDKLSVLEKKDLGKWWLPKNIPTTIFRVLTHGVRQDVVSSQRRSNALSGNINDMHARAARFDNKTEHLYSSLQVLTAATASFCHGANDISNAVAPLATIYLIWDTNTLSSEAPVPIWVLCYCAAALVIGLWTYGYKIMGNLGNRLTLHSPTRGFSMELGSAITVVFATRLSLPVSTTQCILGATIGVALCNGDLKSMNWRMAAWCYLGWILTLPVAGCISGCLMAIILHAPRWGAVAGG